MIKLLKKQFIIKFSHVRTFFNMEKCKFSLGEVVWCKSPKSSNVWPAKIEVDKALGKWFREGKIFLVFYGQVKCQKGRWIELENVVPFNDITEKEMCGPPALAPAYKQAKEDFDKIAGDQPRKKTSLNEVGKSNVSTKTGGNVGQVSSKPAHKTNESRIEQGKSCKDVSVTASAPQSKKPQIKPVFTNEDETVVSRKIGDNKLVAQEKTPITKRKHHNPDELTPKSKKIREESAPPGQRKSGLTNQMKMSFGSASESSAKPGYQDRAHKDPYNRLSPRPSLPSKPIHKSDNRRKQSQKTTNSGLGSDDDKENVKPVQDSDIKKISTPRSKANELKKTSTSVIEKEVTKKNGRKMHQPPCYSRLTDDSYSSICHQCGLDASNLLSKCTSQICPGIRGQFCKTCLKHYYDEDIETVLRCPTWKCPPCRGCCKCSTCIKLQQKHSSSILSQLAINRGHNTVRSYLEFLMKKTGK